MAAIHLLDIGAHGRLVHVSLNDVAVEASLDEHGTLHIHLIAHLEQAQIAAVQRLLDCRHRVGAVTRQLNHRQAHAVM